MNPIEALDEEKATLRVLELLYVRRDRGHPKMMFQSIAELGGVNKTKFNNAIKTLQKLNLQETHIVTIPGKRGYKNTSS